MLNNLNKITYLIVFSFVLSLTGCLDNLRTYWSEGKYEVLDSPTNSSCKNLYYNLGSGSGVGRVECISQIGSNDKYIVAASNDSETKYWILDKEKDNQYFNSYEIVNGPFDLDEFNSKKDEFGISSLGFDKEFK